MAKISSALCQWSVLTRDIQALLWQKCAEAHQKPQSERNHSPLSCRQTDLKVQVSSYLICFSKVHRAIVWKEKVTRNLSLIVFNIEVVWPQVPTSLSATRKNWRVWSCCWDHSGPKEVWMIFILKSDSYSVALTCKSTEHSEQNPEKGWEILNAEFSFFLFVPL